MYKLKEKVNKMSFTGIQATVDLYTMQEAQLENQLSDIMQNITSASSKSSELLEGVTEQKTEVENTYSDSDSSAYKEAMSKIEDKYTLDLSKINQWETELETEKDQKETEIKVATSYKESFMSALKTNVGKSFKYAGGGQG